jgi:hypothetical protein
VSTNDRYEAIVERLANIEEELRDLAYERLTAAAAAPDTDEADAAEKEEKRLLQARRAIAKAIGALSPSVPADEL